MGKHYTVKMKIWIAYWIVCITYFTQLIPMVYNEIIPKIECNAYWHECIIDTYQKMNVMHTWKGVYLHACACAHRAGANGPAGQVLA